MVSAAQLSSRPAVPQPPDGWYAVPDPDTPEVLTLWKARRGQLHPWPPGQRWAPRPPRTDRSLTAEERREQREAWYASTYWPWKVAIATAVTDDPKAAARRFKEDAPQVIPDEPTNVEMEAAYTARRVIERQEDREALRRQMRAAAVLRTAGLSYRRIARAYSVAPSTAWRWTAEGLRIWRDDHQPGELEAAVAKAPPLEKLLIATRPPDPVPEPQESAAAFAAWAAARFKLTPKQRDELLTSDPEPDWDELLALGPDQVDELLAIAGHAVDEPC